MKKLTFMSLAFMGACGSAFAASADFPINSRSWESLSQNLRVINICDLTDQDLNEIMHGDHPEIAIEFSAETTLPISFFLKGDLIQLTETEGKFETVEIKQTFYARCVQDDMILSVNLRDWKPFFEFLTGHASASLSIQEGKPSIVIGAETNLR